MLRLVRQLLNILSRIVRLFRRAKLEAEDIAEEVWEALWLRSEARRGRIRRDKKAAVRTRFRDERNAKYSADIGPDGLRLTTHVRNVFAWTDDPWYRYRDFEIVAEMDLLSRKAKYGAGLLFRKVDDRSFYDFIITTEGRYRFDVVFNGTQIPLIAWTELPGFDPEDMVIVRIFARDTRFTFYSGDIWIGEIVDDTLASGSLAFAVQNYDDVDAVTARLTGFSIDSRPIHVETSWYRRSAAEPVSADRRIALARTFSRMGRYASARIQLSKASRSRDLTASEHLLFGTCVLRSGETDRALTSIDKALNLDPSYVEALVEKANVLYLLNKMLELKEFFAAHIDALSDNPGMWNLYGNCEYALGEWSRAIDRYTKAISIQPDMPLFHANLGRCFERSGSSKPAIDSYAAASRLLFREESYEELERILARIESLDPTHPEIASLEGKLAFYDGNLDKANRKFAELIESGDADSSIYFLRAIIMARLEDRARANELFETALALESDISVYWLRYAENRFALGLDVDEPVGRALALDPNDPWALNLSGIVELGHDLPDHAVTFFRKAHTASNGNSDITANLAEALYRSGAREEAFALLAEAGEDATCLNELGRLLILDERYDEAVRAFERAVRFDGETVEYRENLAAAYIESDRILQAEELLSKLLEYEPSAARYNLMGHVASAKGENLRAESAYLEAIALEPGDDTIACNLVEHYLKAAKPDAAKSTWERLLSESDSKRAVRLHHRIRAATHELITCATCAREWWVPKSIEAQPRLVVKGEPPEETPAGRCTECGNVYCVSCAKQNVKDCRFICTGCDRALKLSDDRLKYLVASYVR